MMYNTGDLGAWREDGEIEMLGRVDDQIKIKVRITRCLCPHPFLKRADLPSRDSEWNSMV